MILSKFDLISPSSYDFKGVGHIRAVRLSDIDALPQKYETYQQYTSLLACDTEALCKVLGIDGDEDAPVFDIFTGNQQLTMQLILVLDFFFDEEVVYFQSKKEYGTLVDGSVVGTIGRDNFDEVTSVILQRCGIVKPEKKEKPKFANKRAEELWNKMYAGGGESPKDFADRVNFDLGNIVSHLASRGSGLNILNIWGMTVYNVYDQFMILRKSEAHDLASTSVAVWGDKEKKYDLDAWYKSTN